MRTPKVGTRRAVAAMLTENTGRHFLDSGDAYGRHWQRNAGLTWKNFDAAPAATIDRYGCVTLSTYHWMVENLTYDADITARFRRWAKAEVRADDSWLANMNEWAEKHCDPHGDRNTVNTYNGEDWLSQVLQWVEYEDAVWGGRVLLVQVHGGADVRGGYSAPRAFRADSWEGLFSYAEAEMGCEGRDDGQGGHVSHCWTLRPGEVWFRTDRRWGPTLDGSVGEWETTEDYDWKMPDDMPTDEDGNVVCPECQSTLHVDLTHN